MATNATSYRLDIYRLGYYGGLGARRVATITPPGPLPHSQPPCHRDSATNLVDCGTWSVSVTWLVPDSAVSGLYFARAVRTDDYATRGRAGCANWRVDQSQLLEDLHHGRPGSDGYRPPLPERHAYVPPRTPCRTPSTASFHGCSLQVGCVRLWPASPTASRAPCFAHMVHCTRRSSAFRLGVPDRRYNVCAFACAPGALIRCS